MDRQQIERLQTKTPEQRLLRVLEREFHQPPRVAQALLEEAQVCFLGHGQSLRAGQMRVTLIGINAGHGRALRDTATTEVIWTVDAGLEDRQVLQRHGRLAVRRTRIQRLLDEALGQGAVASQEDLANALQVSVRTIKRDCAYLQSQGIYLPTRGNLHGIGRGQTHKARIVSYWLQGKTYDQIALHTRHSLSSIRRYVQAFVRLVRLHQLGFSENQVAQLLQIGRPLVREYLVIYRQHDAPEYRERLADQLQRLSNRMGTQRRKKGAQ